MAVTITPAAHRDRGRRVRQARQPGANQLLLALASLAALLAIGTAYAGRTRDSTASGAVNLNTVSDAREIEPPLAARFEHAPDRQFAAAHLHGFLQSVRASGTALPGVNAIARAAAPVDAVRRAPVVEYRHRLDAAAAQPASHAGAPAVLPLFTADDLAAMKPAFSVRTSAEFRGLALRWTAIYIAAFWGVALVWWLCGRQGDYPLLAAAHVLTSIGVAVMLGRADPLRDGVLFVRYVEGVVIGCAAFAAVSQLDLRRLALASFTYLPLAGALFLSLLLILFGGGPSGSGAKVNLGPVQPVEAIRLLLGLFLAGYFARRWEVLRQIHGRAIRGLRVPGWLELPRADYVLPVAACVAAALLFFFVQKDLGPALFVSCIFLAVYAIARARLALALVGLAALAAGFALGYTLHISATLSSRVEMWRSAWDNAARGGDQVAQAIWALSTGGLFGTGLGRGDTRYVPAGHTDLVLASIGEELGFAGLMCVAAVFALIAVRGFRTALRAATDYGFFLATILTLFLVVPALIMAAGTLGALPLTGIVTPFLSYGGSAMTANFASLGMLAAVRAAGGDSNVAAPFRRGAAVLGGVLSVVALALTAILADVQIIHADAYAVRPHLGLQADGVRRYQYNQRVLDIAAGLPRGDVYDRNGLPLATSDPAVARRAAAAYRKRGIDLAGCLAADARCYPLGGAAFHLLGDASTRRNWSARNTSYVERDFQDRLRGFDDRAATVTSVDASGRPVVAVRRDFRELVPLLRHRGEPDASEVRAFLERDRDITLTIDGPFQVRVARILAKYAARSATGRAAAVVLDPATGDVLASVSSPFPGPADDGGEDGGRALEALLDRARYGLYPPGSTFKIVTAAAALRLDPSARRAAFTCAPQPQGRVGARVPGYGVVRDDVLQARPHGRLDMHEALVHSCNAYFAQLAVRLGPEALLDTASLVGVSLARDSSVARARATLPEAAYGQGDVVATPLRMARIAAAIASDGRLREPRITSGPAQEPTPFVSAADASLLARDLRNAVLHGTGRRLRPHPWRIAGKTGTAEVAGAASHAWFVGFAPYGKAHRRIAFAVLIEHAGYGSATAAPAAGEIVTEAAASGLVR